MEDFFEVVKPKKQNNLHQFCQFFNWSEINKAKVYASVLRKCSCNATISLTRKSYKAIVEKPSLLVRVNLQT